MGPSKFECRRLRPVLFIYTYTYEAQNLVHTYRASKESLRTCTGILYIIHRDPGCRQSRTRLSYEGIEKKTSYQ